MDGTLLWAAAGFILVGHLGLDPDRRRIRRISAFQYRFHRLFARFEPLLLHALDHMMESRRLMGSRIGRRVLTAIARMSGTLPHGIVITTATAERVVDLLASSEGPKGARFAIGPCLCQTSCGKYRDPVVKDVFMLYAADMFTSLRREFRYASPEEVKALLRECHEAGLVHELDYCMQSGRWTFCICNCEKEVCVLTRAYLHTGLMLAAGPERIVASPERCLGREKCGRCIERCMFGANFVADDEVQVDPGKCLGCGLCVSTCSGGARKMAPRSDYALGHLVPLELLLGEAPAPSGQTVP
ncbi:MAG: 4Fe-4S binding protein [bacterium]